MKIIQNKRLLSRHISPYPDYIKPGHIRKLMDVVSGMKNRYDCLCGPRWGLQKRVIILIDGYKHVRMMFNPLITFYGEKKYSDISNKATPNLLYSEEIVVKYTDVLFGDVEEKFTDHQAIVIQRELAILDRTFVAPATTSDTSFSSVAPPDIDELIKIALD